MGNFMTTFPPPASAYLWTGWVETFFGDSLGHLAGVVFAKISKKFPAAVLKIHKLGEKRRYVVSQNMLEKCIWHNYSKGGINSTNQTNAFEHDLTALAHVWRVFKFQILRVLICSMWRINRKRFWCPSLIYRTSTCMDSSTPPQAGFNIPQIKLKP